MDASDFECAVCLGKKQVTFSSRKNDHLAEVTSVGDFRGHRGNWSHFVYADYKV